MNRLGFTSRFALLGSAAVLAVSVAGAANAQDQNPPAPAPTPAAAEGDEIVITAQKRQEAILDIPQSVTVVGGETLERQHAVSFSDYQSQIPGLSLEQSQPGETRLVLRGVNTGGVSSTVAVYVDETPFGSSTGLVNGAILAGDFDTFDISRIEVLRGPQGTLYGASSLGGVLKFVTNEPELGKTTARGRAGLEFVDGGGTGYNFSGVVNVPLGDMAAIRGSGFYRKDAGWIDGTGADADFFGVPALGGKNINESQVWGGRGSVLFKPTAELKIRLTAIAQHIESDAASTVEVDPITYARIDEKNRQSRWFRDPNEMKYRLYNGTVDYDLGFASLLSATSFGKSNQTFVVDVTPIYGTAFNLLLGGFVAPGQVIGPFQDQNTNSKKFTQEVRLTSPSSDKFEWMVGAYYTHEEGLIHQFITSVDLVTRQSFGLPFLDDLATLDLDSKYKEIAGFTNVTFHATDRFDITAGARWAHNEQKAHQVSESAVGLADNAEFTIKSDESVFTYALSPRFEVDDRTAIYARIAKGYRPGGPNVIPPATPDVPLTYSSDTITSYEVGLKKDLAHGASFDISAYHLNWKDIQLFSLVNGFGVNVNGGTAVSNGVEGQLTLHPVTGLRMNVNAAYIDAHLTEDTPPLAGGFDGDQLPYVPKFSSSVNMDYEWPLSSSATGFVGGTLAYKGKQRDNFNISDIVGVNPDGSFIFAFTPQRKVSEYATIDLRAGVEFDRFTLEAYVKNLTNTHGVNSIAVLEDALVGNNILPDNAIRAALTRPRTIGLSLTAGF